MAEEKQVQEKKCACGGFKTVLKVLLGILLVLAGGFLVWHYKHHILTIAKGCSGLFLILVGVVVIAIAKD